MDDPYWIMFLGTEPPDAEAVVQICLKQGFMPAPDGSRECFTDCSITDWSGEKVDTEDDSVEAVIAELTDAKSGHLTFWQDERGSVDVSISNDSSSNWDRPNLMVCFSTMQLDTTVDLERGQYTREAVQTRIENIVSLVGALAELVTPDYVYGHIRTGPDPPAGIKPSGRPISEHVDTLPWIAVLSPQIVSAFGGRDRVKNTPAWHVEELSTGHVLIVKTNHPFDPTVEPDVSTDAYLLDGESPNESEVTEMIADPFVQLDPGSLGTDIVIERDDIDADVADTELSLVRCRVIDDALWNLEDGSFVRRTIDAQGNTNGTLPSGVNPAEEPYPPLIRLGVHPCCISMESPTDETLISKVMSLPDSVDKLELLEHLAAAVNDTDDCQAITDLIDQVLNLEDREAISKIIEQQILQ